MRFDLTVDSTATTKGIDDIAAKLTALDRQLQRLAAGFGSVASAAGRVNVPSGGFVSGGTVTQTTGGTQSITGTGPAPAAGASAFASATASASSAIGAGTGAGSPAGAIRLAGFIIQNLANPVVAATAAIVGLAVAAISATQAIADYSSRVGQAGGNQASSDQLSSIANAAGVDRDVAARMAGDLPGKAPQLIQKLSIYRSMRNNPEQASRYAHQNGLDGWENLNEMDDAHFNAAMNGGGAQGFNKGQRGAAANHQADLNGLVNGFQHIATYWGDKIAGVLGGSHYGNAMRPPQTKEQQVKANADKATQAADKQLEAANVIYTTFKGFQGGGAKLRGAFPVAYGWYGAREAMMQDSKTLGAFAQ